MNYLPKLKPLSFIVALVLSLSITSASHAASAYISPAQGLITAQSFMMSVYVESTTTEPQISSTQLKISYPQTVKVVSVTEGQFDSYLEMADNPTARQISINAVNNAGNFKSGQVKVASIRFEALSNTGQVQLTIESDSEISGAGGEQLLTEIINGQYTLNIAGSTPATSTPSTVATTSVTTEPGLSEQALGVNDFGIYLAISLGLVALGIVSYSSPVLKGHQRS